MEKFVAKHASIITGTLSLFDRVIIKGHLALGFDRMMEEFLSQRGVLFKDLKRFVVKQAERVKAHALDLAREAGRPYEYFTRPVRKEQRAREIAARDNVTEGLVCVFGAVEPCRSFNLVSGEGRPRIVGANRKCLVLYFYFIDAQLGLIHVRVPTWFPFTIQVYLNGHEWLARRLAEENIEFSRIDNAFVALGNPARAQELADAFARLDWPTLLDALAGRVNPLLADLLESFRYYWTIHQAEYSTNLVFKDRASLADLYVHLLRHATLSLGAEDVMKFLGRKLTPSFAGEIINDCKKRWPGARVKHWMKENWIKMYDKHGLVLRVETVINNPYEFKVRRKGKRRGVEVLEYFPMPKGIAYMPHFVEVSRAANMRYLDALAAVDHPTATYSEMQKLSRPATANGRSLKGFNPIAKEDHDIFRAVLRGEHALHGFRNSDIKAHLYAPANDNHEERRRSARVGRVLRRLHAHGLIAKIPRSHRWRPSSRGLSIMTASIRLREEYFPAQLRAAA